MGGRRKEVMRVPSFSPSPSPSPLSRDRSRCVEDGADLVLDSISDSNGASAILWMSQAAMLSASLSSSQLIIVSVLATIQDDFGSFHISSLERRCSKHFGIRAGEDLYYEPGSFYAIAVAWPCHKLARNGIRLSRQLANTLGCPSLGTPILVSPVKVSSGEIELKNVRVLRSAESDVDNVSVQESQCLYVRYCPLEESSLQCQHELLSLPATSNDGKSGIMGSEQGSPKTPFSGGSKKKITASSLTKMASAEHSDVLGKQDKGPPLRNNSLVLSILEKGNEMFKDLMQKFISCMLGGRFLLKGNFITIPIHGQTCLFRVVDVPSSQQSLQTSEDYASDKTLPRVSSVFMVCSGTQVRIVPPLSTKDLASSVLETLKDGISEEQKSGGDLEKRNLNLRKLDYTSLGGLSEQIQSLKEIMQLSVLKPDLLMRLGLQPTRGVLLYGPPGTGKTSLALASAYEAGVSIFSINGPEIISEFYGESEAALRAIFTSAQASAPSMVFIDELDAIAPQRKEGSEELAQRMVAALLTLMDGVEQKLHRVMVIAATNRLDAIDPALRRPGRFDMEMEIGVPTPTGRYEILEAILRKMSHSLTTAEVQALAAVTHGFVGADLTALCNEAAMIALRRYVQMKKDEGSKEMSRFSTDEDMGDKLGSQLQGLSLSQGVTEDIYSSECSSLQVEPLLLTINMKDFEEAKSKIGPSAMREVMIEVPKVRWSDIGGNEEVKQQLREAVEWPQKHADAFVRIGTSPPQGVLLYGPPGCSKTLMARAVATEAGLNFISVKGPELLSKWVGESEKAVHKLFARAMAASPSIIFFDEIDGLAGTRDSGNDGVSVGDRVISQLLVEMDGMKSRAGVTVIAATNRPDRIDPALLRPGRFDRLLYIGPPSAASRKEIFDIHMRTMPCGEDVLKTQLINSTHGYTGADIAAICREAAMAALEEDLGATEVYMRHFDAALGNVRPSSFGMSELAYMGFQRG